MNIAQLARLNNRATIRAHVAREGIHERADAEQEARAWERLADAAGALHDMLALRATYGNDAPPPQEGDRSE